MAYSAAQQCYPPVRLVPDFTFWSGHGEFVETMREGGEEDGSLQSGQSAFAREALAVAVAAARSPTMTRCGWAGNVLTSLRAKYARLANANQELMEARVTWGPRCKVNHNCAKVKLNHDLDTLTVFIPTGTPPKHHRQ